MRLLATLVATFAVLTASTVFAQQNSLQNGNVQGTGASGATLSSRFSSDFSRFTAGSTGESGVVGTGAGNTAASLRNTAANVTGQGGLGGGLGGGFGGGAFGGGLGGLGGFAAAGGFNRQNNQNQDTSQTQLRTRLVLGFTPRLPTRPVIATRLQARLNRVTRIRKPGPIQIVMVGQTAVLQGTVASEHDRGLAARMASLEPGVRSIENRLIVAPLPEELPVGPGSPSVR